MQLVKFKSPAGRQLPAGVQNPALSGFTLELAKKYSSGVNLYNSISSVTRIVPLYNAYNDLEKFLLI